MKRWAWFGVLWGLIALSNPSLLLFLPCCGLWILFGAQDWKRQIPAVLLASFLCVACIAPWCYRNWITFHKFVPMRANFGAELYLGNGPDANGLLLEFDHPSQSLVQLRLYEQMGEIAYSKYRGSLASEWIRSNPSSFAALTLKRIYYFWVRSAALRRRFTIYRVCTRPELRFCQPRWDFRALSGVAPPYRWGVAIRYGVSDGSGDLLCRCGACSFSPPYRATNPHFGCFSVPIDG